MSAPLTERQAGEGGGAIDLSVSRPFRLGPLEVRPPTREVCDADGALHLVEPRVMQVLVALAQAQGAVVSRDHLIARCWDGRIVGDDAINGAVAKARQVADLAPFTAFAIETIPRVGYRLLEGGRADRTLTPAAPDQSQPAPPPVEAARRPRRAPIRGRALAMVSVAALMLLASVAGLAYELRSRPPPAQTGSGPSVAVLGFQSQDQTPEARALAGALATRVADALSHYDVKVMGAPAAAQGGEASAAGRADFVVAGRVAEKDHRLVVTAELSEPRDHTIVYAFDAPQPSGDQGDVAQQIANHIALSLDPAKFTNNAEGELTAADYTIVARANDGIDRWDMPYVLDQTRQLVLRHPRDGDLQASLAITAIYNAQQAPSDEQPGLIALARRSIARAAQLSPNSALVSIAKATLTSGPMSLAAEERLNRTALRLDPRQHMAFNGLGEVMLSVGRTQEGEELIERSIELDPMSGVVVGQGLQDLVKGGRADEASDLLRREALAWPGDWRTLLSGYVMAHDLGGDPRQTIAFDEANPSFLQAFRVSGAREAMMARALQTKDPAAVRQVTANCFENYDRSALHLEDVDCLIAMARLGELDQAFRFAAIAFPDHRTLYPAGSADWITKPPHDLDTAWLFSPAMAQFRDDPRFWDVSVRTGLVNYWQATGAWPDFCQGQLARCKQLAAAAAQARPATAPTSR